VTVGERHGGAVHALEGDQSDRGSSRLTWREAGASPSWPTPSASVARRRTERCGRPGATDRRGAVKRGVCEPASRRCPRRSLKECFGQVPGTRLGQVSSRCMAVVEHGVMGPNDFFNGLLAQGRAPRDRFQGRTRSLPAGPSVSVLRRPTPAHGPSWRPTSRRRSGRSWCLP